MLNVMKRRGFTLLELLVVMAIIGILAAIGIGSYGGVQSKARDARRKNDLESIARAAEMFRNDFGRYPSAASAADFGPAWAAGGLIWGRGPWAVNNVTYMAIIPADPRTTNYRWQIFRTNGITTSSAAADIANANGYWLLANLENREDPAAARTTGADPVPGYYVDLSMNPVLNEDSCGGMGCNFVVRSSNAPMPPSVVAY